MNDLRNNPLITFLVLLLAILIAIYQVSAGICSSTLFGEINGITDTVKCIYYTCFGTSENQRFEGTIITTFLFVTSLSIFGAYKLWKKLLLKS